MRWLAPMALISGGCLHFARASEGITFSADRRIGAELAMTAGRFAVRDDRDGLAIGLRCAVLVDDAGVTGVLGLSMDVQRQPPRRGPWFGETAAPYYAAPSGVALRAGAHAGSSLGGEAAALWSRGRGASWNDDLGFGIQPQSFVGVGLELGGEIVSARAFGPETSWIALRLVEEWDQLVASRARIE